MSKSKIQLDIKTIHIDDMGGIIGNFFGTDIREWYPREAAIREDADALWIVASNRLKGGQDVSLPQR